MVDWIADGIEIDPKIPEKTKDDLKTTQSYSNKPMGWRFPIAVKPCSYNSSTGGLGSERLNIEEQTFQVFVYIDAQVTRDFNENPDLDYQHIVFKTDFDVTSQGLSKNEEHARGWFIESIKLFHSTDDDGVNFSEGKPGNVNNQNTLSYSNSVSVGMFGLTPTGNCSISTSSSYTFLDWETTYNLKDIKKALWTFEEGNKNKFETNSMGHARVSDLSSISANGANSFSSTSFWFTNKVRTDKLLFKVTMDVTLAFRGLIHQVPSLLPTKGIDKRDFPEDAKEEYSLLVGASSFPPGSTIGQAEWSFSTTKDLDFEIDLKCFEHPAATSDAKS